MIEEWPAKARQYKDSVYVFKVRDRELKVQTHYESLSHIPSCRKSQRRVTKHGATCCSG